LVECALQKSAPISAKVDNPVGHPSYDLAGMRTRLNWSIKRGMTRDPQNGQNGAKSFFLSFVWIFILKSLA
jgi:hypothetical protein